MSRSWPFFIVILLSFGLGSFWGWRLIKEKNQAEGRFVADERFRLLIPAGLVPNSLIRDFEKQANVSVELTVESSPATLLRKLLKSVPGQFDGAMIFHHQLPSLRTERKLQSLYDGRYRFPTVIAPDFRRLTDDRNLTETAPLLWGLIGVARRGATTKPLTLTSQPNWDAKHIAVRVWPSWLTAYLPSPESLPVELVRRFGPTLHNQTSFFEATVTEETDTAIVTHGQMLLPPFNKDWTLVSYDRGYPLWILTFVAVADGNTEVAQKWLRFLLEPAVARELTLKSRGGASTLRSLEESDLPKELKPSYLRSIPIQDVLLDRDERIRQADELIEQSLAGARLNPVLAAAPAAQQEIPAKVIAKRKPTPAKAAEAAGPSVVQAGDSAVKATSDAATPAVPNAASPIIPPSATVPSGEQSPVD